MQSTTTSKPAEIWRDADGQCVDDLTYHSDTDWLSNSMRSVFVRSRVEFHERYVIGKRPDPTDAQRIGSLLDWLITQPARLARIVTRLPCSEELRSGKRKGQPCLVKSTELYDKIGWRCSRHSGGQDPVTPSDVYSHEQREQAAAMAVSLKNHPEFRRCLDDQAGVQIPIRLVDPTTGLQVKSLPDLVTRRNIVVEIKTAADPTPDAFARSVWQFGYYQQAALECHAVEAVYGSAPAFVFAVVGNSPPYEACMYQLDPRDVTVGHEHNRRDWEEYQIACESGLWDPEQTGSDEWLYPRNRQIETLRMRSWKRHYDE